MGIDQNRCISVFLSFLPVFLCHRACTQFTETIFKLARHTVSEVTSDQEPQMALN